MRSRAIFFPLVLRRIHSSFSDMLAKALVVMLGIMATGGASLLFWAIYLLVSGFSIPLPEGPASDRQEYLALLGFLSSLAMIGVSIVSCAIMGLTVVENRRLRQQAIHPDVELFAHIQEGTALVADLRNRGTGTASDISMCAWVIVRVENGKGWTAESKVYQAEIPQALLAGDTTSRVPLDSPKASLPYDDWRRIFYSFPHLHETMEPKLLVYSISYKGMDGRPLSTENVVVLQPKAAKLPV